MSKSKVLMRFLSLCLSALVIYGVISASTPVFAAEIDNEVVSEEISDDGSAEDLLNDSPEDSPADSEDELYGGFLSGEEEEEAEIIGEDVSLREENVKHFLLSDGTRKAVMYSGAVHFEKDGKWEDIDNTLTLDEESGKYEAAKNSFSVSFNKKLDSEELVELEKDGYSVSFGYKTGALRRFFSKAEVTEALNNEGSAEQAAVAGITSEITYENASNGTTLEYTVTPNAVKENIVVDKKSDKYEYTFSFCAEGLTYALNVDGSIFLNNGNGETVFAIPRPFMFDSENNSSDAVEYIIEKTNDGFNLTVKADSEWINEEGRAFPVTIDPVITTKRDREYIDSTFIASAEKTTNLSSMLDLYLGWDSYSYGHTRTLVQFSLPSLNKGDMVVNATLCMAMYKTSFYTADMDDKQITAHMVTKAWDFEKVTWNTCPTYESTALDYSFIKQSDEQGKANWKYFNITKAVKTWYEGTYANNGILLKRVKEGGTYADDCAYGVFWSEKYNNTYNAYPCVEIVYRNNKGLENYWSYTPVSAGNAGTAYVNDYSGNLVFELPLASTVSDIAPVSLCGYFNGYCSGDAYAAGKNKSVRSSLGKGFRLNIQQTVLPSSGYGLSGTSQTNYPYVYADADGTEHYFKKITENSTTRYEDEDGLGLKLTFGSGNSKYIVTDKSGGVMNFNTKGNLTAVKDSNGNAVSITYTTVDSGDRITKVTDGTGHYFTFSYGSNDYINSITDNAGRKIGLTYSNGKLTGVTYPDGTKSYFTYDSESSLLSAKSNENYRITFEYTEASKGKRISSVVEDGNGTTGQKITFDRVKHNRTVIRTAGLDGTYGNGDDIYTTYTFDDVGRTVSESSKVGNGDSYAGVYEYVSQTSTANSNIKSANKISSSASYGKNVVNLARNGNAENGLWNFNKVNGAEATLEQTTEQKYFGQKSFKLTATAMPKTSAYAYIHQNVTEFTAGKTYTFSAYYKTTSYTAVSGATGDGVYVAARYVDSTNGNGTVHYSPKGRNNTDSSIDGGWRRLSVTFTVSSTAESIAIYVGIMAATGTVYFDGMQLEEGEAANSFNMIENAGFERESSGTPVSWTKRNMTGSSEGVVTNTKAQGSKSVCITGKADKVCEVYQTVNLKNNKNDIYILSGWGAGAPISGDFHSNMRFELTAYVAYNENNYKEIRGRAKFNQTTVGWQYASAAFSLTSSKYPSYTPKSVTIYATYSYACNTVYFDNIQLIKDTAETYFYNSDGDLVKVAENSEQKTNLTYDSSNNLTSYTDALGYKTTLSYDSKHNVTKSVSPRNTATQYTYNAAGQVTSAVTSRTGGDNVTWKIQTKTAYTAADSASGIKAGAYVKSVTNQLDKVTSYDYNMSTGSLKSVTDPAGNKTEYTRVSTSDDRLKTVTSGGTSVSYNYAGTCLKSILFGNANYGENYSFTYDNFGNTVSTKVGNTALSTNTYSENNGVLSKVTYANGDSQSYTYTKEGFLKSTVLIPKNGTAKTASVLTYDSTGRVATLSDKLSIRKTYYTYDSLGRPVRTSVSDDSTGTSIACVDYRYDVRGNMTRYGIAINGHDAANAFYDYTKLKDSDGNIIGYSDDYEKGNLLTRFRIHNNRYIDYSYDRLDRLSQAAFYNGGRTVYKSYSYSEKASQPETGALYSSTQIAREYIDNTAYVYSYDNLGNVKSVKTAQRTNPDTEGMAIGAQSEYRSYEYDGKSQLTRENNATTNKTTVWTYDTLGNITSKTIYPYTTGELGTAEQTVNYTYSNDGKSGWNYLLTGVGNDTITYDSIGNPTSYLGANLSWFGRKLQTYEKDGTSVSYTYDANGMRASKTVNGVKTEYLYLDGALRYEKRGTDEYFYTYDANGNLANIKWYRAVGSMINIYVITNLQGDVVGMYDYKGVVQVSYEYDAWGNTVSITDKTNGLWSGLNPFRYRGYYYDTDTGLYYLGSRYYNPEIGRFLNSDSILSTGEVLGFNNYAYCLNNPANMSDPYGNLPFFVATAAVGAVFGGIIGGVLAAKNGKNVWAGIGIGAAAGGLLGAGAGLFTAAALAGSATAATMFVAESFGAFISAIPLADQFVEETSTAIQTYYPPNNGFSGLVQEVTLETGTLIQRTGSLSGYFVAPAGTPLEMLSLPYDKMGATTSILQLQQPIEVLTGRVAPWFDQIGCGIQYQLATPLDQLIADGIIKLLEG